MKKTSATRRFHQIVAFFFALLACDAVALSQQASSQPPTPQPSTLQPSTTGAIREFRGQTMGTTYMVKIHGAEDVDDDIRIDIDAELRRVNDQMSTYLKSSEISRFNASDSTRWFDVSRQTADVVDFAQQVARKTDGAFDVTIGPVVNAWGFGPDQRTGETPDREKLAQLKALTGFEKLSVRLDPPALRKQIPQLQVDLSAIAKGHGVDRVVTLLAEAGATDVFVEIGGEVRTSGDKAGQPWRVGIQLPDTAATVSMIAHETGRGTGQDESMATSGDYRNFFQDDGKRYSHTIDPRTAAPIVHHLASVSVVSQSCMAADAWATAINVLGPEKGLELAERESLDAFLITRTDNGYHMMGTGLLAQYATIAPPAAAVAADTTVRETASTGLLPTMLMSAVAMGVILLAMAIGVIFGRKAISGSCGGLANETDADGNVSCSLCSNPADACKELRERMQQSESPT